MLEIGRLTAETIMYMEREEKAGPDYHPSSPGLHKWASQRGGIYVGDQKIGVEHRCEGLTGKSRCRPTSSSNNEGLCLLDVLPRSEEIYPSLSISAASGSTYEQVWPVKARCEVAGDRNGHHHEEG